MKSKKIFLNTDYHGASFIWSIRFSLVKILIGNSAVIGNCFIRDLQTIVTKRAFIFNNTFVSKGFRDRTKSISKKGIILKPVVRRKRK